MVQLIHAVIRRSLNQAVKWGLITRNPALATNPPKPKKTEMKFFNEDQVKRLLVEVDETKYSALYHLAVTTGMRQGELLGLIWSDIDWENKQIRVQRQAQRITG
jgi:integrase